MKKVCALILAALALVLALTGCQGGVRIVPIESLSPKRSAAGAFSAQPVQAPSPTPARAVERIDPSGMTLGSRINPPVGCTREHAMEGSLSAFLRAYPLKAHGAQVMLHTGEMRPDARAAAVLDVTLGKKNHEGPAGAMARLIAEYLYDAQKYGDISFTIGGRFDFTFDKWRQGSVLKDGGMEWTGGGQDSNSEENFKKYLTTLFVYISMDNLKKDLVRVEDVDGDPVRVGDIFLGRTTEGKDLPLMVADVCRSDETGERLMLLVQGGAPAQQLHVVQNPASEELSPWFPCDFGADLTTPDATVAIEERYRYKNFVEEEE